jgi:hypothetical protein
VQPEPLRLPGRAASFPCSISSPPSQPLAAAAQLGSQQTHPGCPCACAAAAAEGRPGRAEGRGHQIHAGQSGPKRHSLPQSGALLGCAGCVVSLYHQFNAAHCLLRCLHASKQQAPAARQYSNRNLLTHLCACSCCSVSRHSLPSFPAAV